MVCQQGERHGAVYFVREGYVALSAVDPDGMESTASVRGPMSLLCAETIQGAPSAFQVSALTSTRLCKLDSEGVSRWMGNGRSPTAAMLDLALAEIRLQQRDLTNRRGTALARVARFILDLAERSDRDQRPALRKQAIARLLGMRAETLSRCLGKLSDGGMIDARVLRVLDADKLARAAHRPAAAESA